MNGLPYEYEGLTLLAPEGFDHTKYKTCDGCGSGWNKRIVPDSIFFVNIRIACCIHDYRYEQSGTIEDKRIADNEFYVNIIAILEPHFKKWYFPASRAKFRAKVYYEFVEKYGDHYFFSEHGNA